MRRTMVNMETMKKGMEVAILRTRTSRRIQTSTQLQQERDNCPQEQWLARLAPQPITKSYGSSLVESQMLERCFTRCTLQKKSRRFITHQSKPRRAHCPLIPSLKRRRSYHLRKHKSNTQRSRACTVGLARSTIPLISCQNARQVKKFSMRYRKNSISHLYIKAKEEWIASLWSTICKSASSSRTRRSLIAL